MPTKSAPPPAKAKPGPLKELSLGRRDIRLLALQDIEIIQGENPRQKPSRERLEVMKAQLRTAAGEDPESNGQKEAARGRMLASGKFGLTTGNTRYLALSELFKEHARFGHMIVQPEPKTYTDLERQIDHITSNDGAPLQMHEQATVYKRLRDDHKQTVKQIHQRTGKTEQHIYDCLSLLDLDQAVKDSIAKGLIAPSTVVEIAKAERPDLVTSTVRTAIATATLAGKSKATSKHVLKANTKAKKGGGKPKAKKDDLKAAQEDLIKTETQKRMATAAEYQADSVARLQDLLSATLPGKCLFERRRTIEWMIDYLKGTKELPAAIRFLQGDEN